ncbi:response regulator transcription factor [Nocardioides sp. CER19]|uniref:response regulator transcription factor n=1 Tax=Nocardioides sp. CER19 TaxID=3038538 RepID=UPI002448EBB2|nr:response regulator transcription factor [Nocardioides sp. CER19]MDH2413975.1 response regulator transcription factor [Nocardioides sp. CER19]
MGLGVRRWEIVRCHPVGVRAAPAGVPREMSMSKILVADDEDRVRTFLSRSLVSNGHSVVAVPDGQAALDAMDAESISLALLDIVMPYRNGLQVLTELRERGDNTPVIVLSAVTQVAARVQALDHGAVDFVVKPFHPSELMARVRRHIVQAPELRHGGDRYLTSADIVLDLDRRKARVGRAEVSLTEREFSMLAHLMRRRGDVCRRDELLNDIWGEAFGPSSNVVDVCVGRLRNKMRELPVETIRGVGYCFYGA